MLIPKLLYTCSCSVNLLDGPSPCRCLAANLLFPSRYCLALPSGAEAYPGGTVPYEGSDPCWWLRLQAKRRNSGQAQAHDRDRRKADSLAHHEVVLPPRDQRFHHLLRLQGRLHQGVLRKLRVAHVRRDLRHARSQDELPE